MAKQKQTVKLKEPVRIRFKQLSNGNQSIYLEHYTGDVIRKENYVTTVCICIVTVLIITIRSVRLRHSAM